MADAPPAGIRCFPQYYIGYPTKDDYKIIQPDFRETVPETKLTVSLYPEEPTLAELQRDEKKYPCGRYAHCCKPLDVKDEIPIYNVVNHEKGKKPKQESQSEKHFGNTQRSSKVDGCHGYTLFDPRPHEMDVPFSYYCSKYYIPGYKDTRIKADRRSKWGEANVFNERAFGAWHKTLGRQYGFTDQSRRL